MRKLLGAVCLLLSVTATFGAPPERIEEWLATSVARPVRPSSPAEKAAELQALRNARATKSGRARTTALLGTGFGSWLYIPVAGSAAGSHGTFYSSDLAIANYRNSPQIVRVSYIPQGGNGASLVPQEFTVAANQVLNFHDMVGSVLGYGGIGSLEITARTSQGDLDSGGMIDAFSRIWTPEPNFSNLGTVSQNFNAVEIDHTSGPGGAVAIGLRHDSVFHTNFGILNLDFNNPHTWNVKIIGARGRTSMDVTVPAYSMLQTSVPVADFGTCFINFTPPADIGDNPWSAYGSSTDNGTGDGWVSQATQLDSR